MTKAIGGVLGVCAVALVVAAALGTAPMLVLPVPWGFGLIGVAMLAVMAQPSATRAARNAARTLFAIGGVGSMAAWGAWLADFDRPDSPGGMPDQLDSVVDLGSSTAALALAALIVVAVSASARTTHDPDVERTPISADA